jgi:hypothetical protein
VKIGPLEIDWPWLVIAPAAWAGYAIIEISGGPGNLSTAAEIATALLAVVIAIASVIAWKRLKHRR